MAIAALPTKVARVSSPLAQAPRSTNTSQDASETLHTRPTQSLGVQQVLSAGLRQFVGHGPLYATTYLPDIPANVTIRVEHSTVDDAAPEAAELLAHLRSQTGLPVEVLAGALGVSRQTFYNWLYGETPSATNETRIRALANLVANRLEGRQGRSAKRYLLGRDKGAVATRMDEIAHLVTPPTTANEVDVAEQYSSDSVELSLSPGSYGEIAWDSDEDQETDT